MLGTLANEAQSGASMLTVVSGLQRVIGLVSEREVDHGTLVASLASDIGKALGLQGAQLEQLLVAGLLHDVGSLAGEFDGPAFESGPLLPTHPEKGGSLLAEVAPLREVADIVRHHHRWWSYAVESMPESAFIVHLADVIALCVANGAQCHTLHRPLTELAGHRFAPRHVEAFLDQSCAPDYWEQRIAHAREAVAADGQSCVHVRVDRELVACLCAAFARIIDMRSSYTAQHSARVARVAARLGQAARWSDATVAELEVAGYLHDLGKIAIGRSLLEKPGRLEEHEMNLMRTHPALSHRALAGIPGFERVALWASQHHERMDGQGYPFGVRQADFHEGSRLLAVADVYAALSEDRPYRPRLPDAKVLSIMHQMVSEGALDPDMVTLLETELESLESLLTTPLARTG